MFEKTMIQKYGKLRERELKIAQLISRRGELRKRKIKIYGLLHRIAQNERPIEEEDKACEELNLVTREIDSISLEIVELSKPNESERQKIMQEALMVEQRELENLAGALSQHTDTMNRLWRQHQNDEFNEVLTAEINSLRRTMADIKSQIDQKNMIIVNLEHGSTLTLAKVFSRGAAMPQRVG